MKINTWHQKNTPKSCESLLKGLKDLETQAQQIKEIKKSNSVTTELLEKFHDHHNNLLAETANVSLLFHQEGLLSSPSEDIDTIFIEAVWLALEQYPAIVHHPDIENIDTAGSKIFDRFIPDSPVEESEQLKLKSYIQDLFEVDSQVLRSIEQKLTVRAAPLQHRHQIMRFLQSNFRLVSDNPQLDADVLKLFRYLYPGAPFEVGEVKLIKTCSALYFCLPSKLKEPATIPTHPNVKKQNSKKVRYFEFLRKIWEVEPFANFPVFGTFDADDLDITFREQIANETGLTVELVTTTLTRMVGFLPLEELDKYLIHDTWGHQWQESLLDFEDLYTELSLFDRPLSLTESASVMGEQKTFSEAFSKSESGEISLNTEKLTAFIDAELYERSIIAFTPILAEMLADVVEYKFLELYPEEAHLMPSSSLLKAYPSKLDLTLEDLRNCFKKASEAFQTWVDSDEAKHSIHAEICEQLDITDDVEKHIEVDRALDKAVQLCKNRLDLFYKPDWHWEESGDNCLKLNAFTFAALNFLRIHNAFLNTYQKLSQLTTQYGFKDALILAMGTFFELEPQRNIWHLHEFLTEGFLPRWVKLTEACEG
ncbi:hypothetical protein F4X73_11290 [Candidatus Poribacteria bacterium]|nr:hypothetical protein [Candidatus Poribacteria bacterium]